MLALFGGSVAVLPSHRRSRPSQSSSRRGRCGGASRWSKQAPSCAEPWRRRRPQRPSPPPWSSPFPPTPEFGGPPPRRPSRISLARVRRNRPAPERARARRRRPRPGRRRRRRRRAPPRRLAPGSTPCSGAPGGIRSFFSSTSSRWRATASEAAGVRAASPARPRRLPRADPPVPPPPRPHQGRVRPGATERVARISGARDPRDAMAGLLRGGDADRAGAAAAAGSGPAPAPGGPAGAGAAGAATGDAARGAAA